METYEKGGARLPLHPRKVPVSWSLKYFGETLGLWAITSSEPKERGGRAKKGY